MNSQLTRLAIAAMTSIAFLNLSLEFAVAQTAKSRQGSNFPGRRVAGGTRSASCIATQPAPMTAITPKSNMGLTAAANPRFFWFMPQSRAEVAEFTLYDVNADLTGRTLVYKTTIELKGQSGLFSIQLPKELENVSLKVGQNYYWAVAVVCDPDSRENDVIVDGWIRRTEPDAAIAGQLAKATPPQQATLYSNNGYWYDALTLWTQLRCDRATADTPGAKGWTSLLAGEGLGDVAKVSSCALITNEPLAPLSTSQTRVPASNPTTGKPITNQPAVKPTAKPTTGKTQVKPQPTPRSRTQPAGAKPASR